MPRIVFSSEFNAHASDPPEVGQPVHRSGQRHLSRRVGRLAACVSRGYVQDKAGINRSVAFINLQSGGREERRRADSHRRLAEPRRLKHSAYQAQRRLGNRPADARGPLQQSTVEGGEILYGTTE